MNEEPITNTGANVGDPIVFVNSNTGQKQTGELVDINAFPRAVLVRFDSDPSRIWQVTAYQVFLRNGENDGNS